MKKNFIFIAGLLGALIGVSGIVLVIIAVVFYHNEPIPPVNFLELSILLICCFLGFSNSLIGFTLGEKNALNIYFIPLGLPLLISLIANTEPKIGALIHVSVIEAVFIWIAGSIGMHLKGLENCMNQEIQTPRILMADSNPNKELQKLHILMDDSNPNKELQKLHILMDDSNPNASVAVLLFPFLKYPSMGETWENYPAVSLANALLPLADRGESSIIVDLSAMRLHSFSAYRVIDEVWLRLAERGKALVLVFSDESYMVQCSGSSTSDRHDLAYELELHGLRATCAIVRTLQDAIPLASVTPSLRALDNEAVNRLAAIQQRFQDLIQLRVGRLWDGASPPKFPEASRLYRAGVKQGGFAFPYGGLSWAFVGTGTGLVLKYKDSARIAEGWGCRYEISSEATKLVESGLD